MSEPDRGLQIEYFETVDQEEEAERKISSHKDAIAILKKEVISLRKRRHDIREEMRPPSQSDRPLLAAIAAAQRNGPPEETADERQRVPVPMPAPAADPPSPKRRKAK